MISDALDQVRVEQYRRVDVWIDALRDFDAAGASGDPDAISEAEEAVLEAGMAIAEPAIGNALRSRMASAIEPLDNQDDDDETLRQRALMMHRRPDRHAAARPCPRMDVFIDYTHRQLNGDDDTDDR